MIHPDSSIAVVCGGISTEREVSLRSGKAVYQALLEGGCTNLTLFDFTGDNLTELLELHPAAAFLALHGVGGEDGCIQGALELAGIPYTGPGVMCSAVCMNKVYTKQVLAANGLPTAPFAAYWDYEARDRAALQQALLDTIGLPMVLKSPCQGSSIGVYLIHREEEIAPAVEEIFKLGNQLLAEQFLHGVELTLPVIGNDEITVLPDIEITSEREFYDYKAKYTQGLCHHIIPSRISEADREKVREIGAQVYRKLNCRGLSRIDFILDRERGPMVIEVNTLPGMTAMSLVPDSARAMGISFDKLCLKLLELAVEEHGKG